MLQFVKEVFEGREATCVRLCHGWCLFPSQVHVCVWSVYIKFTISFQTF